MFGSISVKTELVEVFIAQGLLKWNLDLLFFSLGYHRINTLTYLL